MGPQQQPHPLTHRRQTAIAPTWLETDTTAPSIEPMEWDMQITITTLNVVSARGTRLLEAMRAMDDLNTDVALLTETKITNDRHARQGHGYKVFASNATSAQKGGVALLW